MAITQAELGRRIRAAREAAELSQQDVANALEIPRTAVVNIEAGERKVSILELEKLAKLVGRSFESLVAEDEAAESPVVTLFRTAALGENPDLRRALTRVEGQCREASSLEDLLDRTPVAATMVQYDLGSPGSRWDAIVQGRRLADLERTRLGLGASPVGNLADVIKGQGIRVAEADLPAGCSGVFFHGRGIGSVIIVRREEVRARKLFSCAHEYCHALADRERVSTVSRAENHDELPEIRANAFAAYFLMPEEGVRRYFDQIGKGPESRLVHQIFASAGTEHEAEDVEVQKRSASSRGDLQVADVVGLSHYFGVSFEAALYHLLNLKYVNKPRFEELKASRSQADRIRSILRWGEGGEGFERLLPNQLFELGLEAYRRGLISRGKMKRVANDADVALGLLDGILDAEGPADEATGPLIPG